MYDDLVLTMKKDKAGIPLAKIHILAGTYPEHILSLESAQDYEFELLPEGQLFGISSDEEFVILSLFFPPSNHNHSPFFFLF